MDEKAQIDHPMGAMLFAQLKKLTATDGPFMAWDTDKEFLPLLLAWVGKDWQRLRLILNYVHERGEQHAMIIAQRALKKIGDSIEYRVTDTWEHRLGQKTEEKEND